MIVLALICIITFAFSIAALSLSQSQQGKVLEQGWNKISIDTRHDIQNWGNCCGFKNATISQGCEHVCIIMNYNSFRRRYSAFDVFSAGINEILQVINIFTAH